MRDDMGYAYRSYAEAASNRRRDEMTVYDPITNSYYNVKSFFGASPKTPRGFRW